MSGHFLSPFSLRVSAPPREPVPFPDGSRVRQLAQRSEADEGDDARSITRPPLPSAAARLPAVPLKGEMSRPRQPTSTPFNHQSEPRKSPSVGVNSVNFQNGCIIGSTASRPIPLCVSALLCASARNLLTCSIEERSRFQSGAAVHATPPRLPHSPATRFAVAVA